MIKIVSGYTEKGGSTTAFINLTNLLNKEGISCILYGPHSWHLNKCRSGIIAEATFEKDDIFIFHFLKLKLRPDVKKVVLSCHEKNLFKVGQVKQYWDEVVFINKEHRQYHSEYNGKFSIIPNLKQELTLTSKTGLEGIAAVIGTIDYNKQTHLSIQRAIDDNCKKVYVYGPVNDPFYFKNYVEPKFKDPRVEYKGFEPNKQKMYESVERVYHSSISEVACLIKDECYQTGTLFFGNSATTPEVSTLTNTDILNLWKKTLQI